MLLMHVYVVLLIVVCVLAALVQPAHADAGRWGRGLERDAAQEAAPADGEKSEWCTIEPADADIDLHHSSSADQPLPILRDIFVFCIIYFLHCFVQWTLFQSSFTDQYHSANVSMVRFTETDTVLVCVSVSALTSASRSQMSHFLTVPAHRGSPPARRARVESGEPLTSDRALLWPQCLRCDADALLQTVQRWRPDPASSSASPMRDGRAEDASPAWSSLWTWRSRSCLDVWVIREQISCWRRRTRTSVTDTRSACPAVFACVYECFIPIQMIKLLFLVICLCVRLLFSLRSCERLCCYRDKKA